jgi:hypothetical protein
MCACHREDMGRLIDHRGSEWLAAKTTDVHALFFADLDGVETRRLAADSVHPGRRYFDVLPISEQPAKKSFCDGTAANVTCADKKYAFHDSGSANARHSNLGSNMPKSIC